ncbi:MAG: hypothetical protein OEW88_06940 [Gammaproteobacteria bacterium]|nr:hypothetical protein [Gammaproteobacteria bacterium]
MLQVLWPALRDIPRGGVRIIAGLPSEKPPGHCGHSWRTDGSGFIERPLFHPKVVFTIRQAGSGWWRVYRRTPIRPDSRQVVFASLLRIAIDDGAVSVCGENRAR